MISRIGQDDVDDVPVAHTMIHGVETSDFQVVGDAEWGWQRHDADELLWGSRGSLVVDAADGIARCRGPSGSGSPPECRTG